MRVLTLNPPFLPRYSRQSRSPSVCKGATFYYPYYLAYATANLEKNGFDVSLIDAVANNWSHEETVRYAAEFKPDLIIIDTSTPSIYNDIEVAEKLKLELPDVHINLTGTFPTNLPEDCFSFSESIDSVCRSEYEVTTVDLAKTIESNGKLEKITGLSFQIGGIVYHNEDRELMTSEELDELPFVSEVYNRHLNIEDYFYASIRHPEVTILTSRGCPYNCTFCNIPLKQSYRARSPKNVVDEMEYIEKELPFVEEIQIEDDTFDINKKRTKEICREIIRRGLKVRWSCNARVNSDYKTMRLMRKANCRLMCVGFESAENEVLDAIKKVSTLKKQEDFMVEANKAGLIINGCFIFGLPHDNHETMRKTIELAKRLNPDTAQFYPMQVYPGTEAFDWAKRENYLTTEDFSEWVTSEGMHKTLISRPELTAEEVVDVCDIARKEYYFRPSYIWQKFIQGIRQPQEGWRTYIGFMNFWKYLVFGSEENENRLPTFKGSKPPKISNR